MRSNCSATSGVCVTINSATFSSRQASRNRSITCCWWPESTFAVGSSANKQPRPVGQRPGDGDPLLLADGKLGRLVRHAMAQSDAVEQVLRPGAVRPAAGETHAQEHVLQRREAGQQVEVLEDVADLLGPEAVALGLGEQGDVPLADPDLARVGTADARDHVQQRRFAAAAPPDQHHLLAGAEREPFDIQDRQFAAVRLGEGFFDVGKL